MVEELAPINRRLIEKRETIQKKLDDWHKKNADKDFDKVQYLNFLKSISYIVEKKKILILLPQMLMKKLHQLQALN